MSRLAGSLAVLERNAERLRGEEGETGRQGRPGTTGKAGDPGLTWRGTFAYGTTYQPGDVVEWEGSSYVALVVTARRPPDPDWDLLAAKGEAGASGRGYIRGGGGSSGSALTIKDEGVSLTAAAASLDFAGAGVTATAVGGAVTVTVPGGGTISVNNPDHDDPVANVTTIITGSQLTHTENAPGVVQFDVSLDPVTAAQVSVDAGPGTLGADVQAVLTALVTAAGWEWNSDEAPAWFRIAVKAVGADSPIAIEPSADSESIEGAPMLDTTGGGLGQQAGHDIDIAAGLSTAANEPPGFPAGAGTLNLRGGISKGNQAGGDVVIHTTRAGASGASENPLVESLRVRALDGFLKLSNTPTSDPSIAGVVWNNAGVLMVSNG